MNTQALRDYFEAQAGAPAALGHLDCVRFAIEALRAGWDRDFTDVLGYRDRRTAIDRLRLSGGLEQAFTDELGPPIDPAQLEPGDLAFFLDPAIGLVMPGYIAVKWRRTVARVPLQFAAKGWHTWARF